MEPSSGRKGLKKKRPGLRETGGEGSPGEIQLSRQAGCPTGGWSGQGEGAEASQIGRVRLTDRRKVRFRRRERTFFAVREDEAGQQLTMSERGPFTGGK